MAQILSDALRVEVGYGSAPLTALSAVTWTDVTSSVRLSEGVQFNRGRFGNDATPRPGSLSFTLDNGAQAGTAGRFTSGGTKIDLRLPVRVRAKFPLGGSTYVDLWVGYVESVQAGWDGGYRPVLRVSATDRLGRLEKRKLPSLIRGVQSALGAVAMWPLDDLAGATSAGEQSPSADARNLIVRQLGTGGTIEFGQTGLGPSADDFACAIFTPAAPAGGLYGDGKFLRTLSPGAAWLAATSAATHEVFFYYTGSGGASAILVPGGTSSLRVRIDSSGNINLLYDTTSVGPAVTVDTWHHLAITQSLSGTTVTTKAYLDGVEFGSQTQTVPAGTNVGPVYVGGGDGTVFSGRMSHVACYPSALSAAQVALNANLRFTLNGYEAEDADVVFNRICQASGIPSTEYQVDGATEATMSPLPVAGAGLLDAATQVATAEAGVVYLNRSGVLTLAAREKRRNPVSAFTVPARCVDRGTSFSTDMNFMVNDVTVKRPAGSTTRYVSTTSTTAYDTHDLNVEAYLATDNQAEELASRLARVTATPEPRVSDIKVDLVTGAVDLDEDAILKADVGTYFQVTNLPTGSPASTLHLFVEGVSHEITDSAWQVTMTTTPASEGFFRNTWVLGDANLSQLGSTTVLAF